MVFSKPLRLATCGLLPFGLAAVLEGQTRWRIDIEGGMAWAGRAEFGIPGKTGTRIDLADQPLDPRFAPRITLSWNPTRRWSLRALAAPLTFEAPLVSSGPIVFDDTRFPEGQPLTGSYRFDSYRLSGYYRFRPDSRLAFRLGLTAKVRSARIALDGPDRSDAYDNVGFVPLIYGGARLRAAGRLTFDLEIDALGAPQGRAEDVALKAECALSDRLSASVGYRLVEGGADNDKVYTFALFHYATLGISYRF